MLPDLRGGGVERVRLSIAREFVSRGRSIELVLMSARGELLDEARSSFPIVDLEAARVRDVPRALSAYLRRRHPAALLAAMWPLSVVAPVVQKVSGHRCRTVVSEHNTLSIQYRGRGRGHATAMRSSMALGYRAADAVVGVSAGVVEDLHALSGVPRSKFHVVYNPVPPRPGRADPAQAELAWAGAARGGRIISVGSLKAQKNHRLLLRAFAKTKHPGAKLLILGIGPLEAELRQLADTLGIANRVSFGGFVSDPTAHYAGADLFVLSSDYEGFGNVIVEALAAGIRVVSTDCPSGPSEILAGGEFGLLAPVGDVDGLASAIDKTLDTPIDADRLRGRAADFSVARTAAAYERLLFPERA